MLKKKYQDVSFSVKSVTYILAYIKPYPLFT